jgi:hypothetical protein
VPSMNFLSKNSTQTFKGHTSKTIVVLGNAKSGTSLVAGLTHILGVDLGSVFIEADEYNPRGYFEDSDFVHLTDAIFKSAQTNYWSFPSQEKLLAQGNKFDQRIQKLLREKGHNKQLWGWKDPWTNILIELFLPHLINPYFIVIFRNPLSTAHSIARFTRGKQSEAWVQHPVGLFQGIKLANFYDKILLEFFEKHPRLPHIFLAFEDIIDDPVRETKKMAGFLDIRLTQEQKKSIENFVIIQDSY